MNNKIEKTYGNVKVIERADYTWGVTDLLGNIIVPFGKYGWIDGFDHGLARVKSFSGTSRIPLDSEHGAFGSPERPKWGIINEAGEEVIPLEYDNIWNFLGKNRENTRLEKDGEKYTFTFGSREIEEPFKYDDGRIDDYDFMDDEPGWGSYDKYGGYNGYDDFTIDSAFEGDPDATWNID